MASALGRSAASTVRGIPSGGSTSVPTTATRRQSPRHGAGALGGVDERGGLLGGREEGAARLLVAGGEVLDGDVDAVVAHLDGVGGRALLVGGGRVAVVRVELVVVEGADEPAAVDVALAQGGVLVGTAVVEGAVAALVQR